METSQTQGQGEGIVESGDVVHGLEVRDVDQEQQSARQTQPGGPSPVASTGYARRRAATVWTAATRRWKKPGSFPPIS